MKPRSFVPPNYRAIVVDERSDPDLAFQRLEHAETMEPLERKLLDDGFIIVELHPYDFNEWKERAKAAARNANVEYLEYRRQLSLQRNGELRIERYRFKSDLWGELKDYLLRCFGGKCAYCEARIETVSHGEVEHYRPKAKVEEDENHPGYYWLAYDEANYFPACTKCNGARAKMNHFPIEGQRARGPEDNIDLESPLLLNPYKDDFLDHLRFKQVFVGEYLSCTVEGKSRKGEESIDVYNLKRRPLLAERGRECGRAIQDVLTNIMSLGRARAIEAFLQSLPQRQFPTACIDLVESTLKVSIDRSRL